MELKVKDMVSQIDLNKSEVFLPLYESIVNSIISLDKVDREKKYIEVIIERNEETQTPNLFGRNAGTIKSITIIDNGEGFTTANYKSFNSPYGQMNKKYGCKGIGRFTILAMFEKMEITSIYEEGGKCHKRTFEFDPENEITNEQDIELQEQIQPQTKVILRNCINPELLPGTARNVEDIAKGIMEHCFIYYLCGTMPQINVGEKNEDGGMTTLSVNDYYSLESKDKEKDLPVGDENFHLYVVKSNKTTSRKYNYVSLCANSRVVGSKKNLADIDSLYTYPITENGESKFIDIYVVSPFLDKHVNSSRTAFKIPERIEDDIDYKDEKKEISIESILKAIAKEIATMYETYAVETKNRNIKAVKEYITNSAPEYRSFLLRDDILEAMPPNLTDEKKEAYLHGIAYTENKKIAEKIDKFIQLNEVNEKEITNIIDTIKKRTAYDADKLVGYVSRRKAIISLFEKMLEMKENGKYELESMIHNLIFPMGLTNESVSYQYHNLWLLDDRFSTFRFIASDCSITSISQIRSSKEPDVVLINDAHLLLNNAISYGDKDMGEVGTMVIFEFKRPGDMAHQKNKGDYRWEFSELVEQYFDDFLYGKEKLKKNWKGQKVHVTENTPKFGYVIMDEMPDELIRYNKGHQWRQTPFGSYYKINPDLNLHIEAMDFQTLLRNAKDRNNPFFDHLFTAKM